MKAALLEYSGRPWSITSRPGYLTIRAPKERMVGHRWRNRFNARQKRYYEVGLGDCLGHGSYTPESDCLMLMEAFGLEQPVSFIGLDIPEAEWGFYLTRIEALVRRERND